jgi:hypothetical protein
VTQLPPEPPGEPPATPASPPSSPGGPPPYAPPPSPGFPGSTDASERIRIAWQRRAETDYVFDFWTAFGWTILTCGIYGFYVLYQLVRRARDHNARRLELLDAATTYAWERADARGLTGELRPAFDRISQNMSVLRSYTNEFRDPAVWLLLDIVASVVGLGGVVHVVAYCLLDGDLIRHDRAEGAIEAELSEIFGRLGAAVPPPDPARVKEKHNYVGRNIATIVTCGIYGLWWTYDVMTDWNKHFEHNWRWEDALAGSVQQLAA